VLLIWLNGTTLMPVSRILLISDIVEAAFILSHQTTFLLFDELKSVVLYED